MTIIDLKQTRPSLGDRPIRYGTGHLQGIETNGNWHPGDRDDMRWLPNKTYLKAGDLRLEVRNQVTHQRHDGTILFAYLFADDEGFLFGALFTCRRDGWRVEVPHSDPKGVVAEVWGIFSNLDTFIAWLKEYEAPHSPQMERLSDGEGN